MRTLLLLAALLMAAPVVRAQTAPAPLIARYDMQQDKNQPGALVDSGPLHLNGKVSDPAGFVPGRAGAALRFDGKLKARVDNRGMLDAISDDLTITAWIQPTAFGPQSPIVAKRTENMGEPLSFGISDNGRLYFNGQSGANWIGFYSGGSPIIPLNQWTHVAVTYKRGGKIFLFQNSKSIDSRDALGSLSNNDSPLVLGWDWMWNLKTSRMEYQSFMGLVGSVHIYAAVLTPEQIAADMNNTLTTRAAQKSDFAAPHLPVSVRLVRYDAPFGFAEDNYGHGHTRQNAIRRAGPDAVDWPNFTLTDPRGAAMPLFADGPESGVQLPLMEGDAGRPIFRQPYDSFIEPGGFWLRGIKWMWGQSYVYTTDRTARTWMGDYELWTFPVRIAGAGAQDIADVELSYKGKSVYKKAGPFHSLTLLLPQAETSAPFMLTVNGRGPVALSPGLEPIVPGAPRETLKAFNLKVPGAGPAISVVAMTHSDTFPNQKEWDADLAALAAPAPDALQYMHPANTLADRVGRDVPRSPMTVHFVALPHGMSSGSFYASEFADVTRAFHEIGAERDYADYLASTGYDFTFERLGMNQLDGATAELKPGSLTALAQALASRNIGLGFVQSDYWGVPFLQHPNLAYLSAGLPRYHAPLYRDIQLAMQRLNPFGNLVGESIGADNGAYVTFWDWAPPIPNRPWAESFVSMHPNQPTSVPISAAPGRLYPHDQAAKNVKEFLDYIDTYDETFKQYGYFARATAEVSPSLITTSGSFGSSPGIGASGGWPWATIPGKPMFEGMQVLQAYDWNESRSSLPMHNEALVDRLRSWYPDKPAWTIVDDFNLLFGEQARARAYALALTRGLKSIGTNCLPNPSGPKAHPEIVTEQQQLYTWIHRYGGPYSMTEPTTTIGIVYDNGTALMRQVQKDTSAAARAKASHEGKTTEALFLCHAAGWPARIVTVEELKRGLPADIKALLCVGLNDFDDSRHWYDSALPMLRKFTADGGRILLDNESVSPIPAVKTNMNVLAYVAQDDRDWTPEMIRRNKENIGLLRGAMQGVHPPIAVSTEPTVWAIPTLAGNTQYVTVVNQAMPAAASDKEPLSPQTGKVQWNTDRPIYDVRNSKRLTPNEAASVDLTDKAFQWYALPTAPIVAPEITVKPDAEGFYRANVTISNPQPMTGLPVQLIVQNDDNPQDAAVVYSATGLEAKLPLRINDAGSYTVTAKELITGLKRSITVAAPGKKAAELQAYQRQNMEALNAFAKRKSVPLVIALTAAQKADPVLRRVADDMAKYYRTEGRTVTLDTADTDGVVRSLQPQGGSATYPRWYTVDADLVLMGSPADNVLMLDEARGGLLPKPGASAQAYVVYSPFVGERQTVNLLAASKEGIRLAADKLMKALR